MHWRLHSKNLTDFGAPEREVQFLSEQKLIFPQFVAELVGVSCNFTVAL